MIAQLVEGQYVTLEVNGSNPTQVDLSLFTPNLFKMYKTVSLEVYSETCSEKKSSVKIYMKMNICELTCN